MLRGSMQSIRWRCWCRASHEGPLARGTRCRTRRILSIGERVRSGIFFATMALASAMSLLRGFVVAGLLDPAAFGTYVVIVAAGTFGSNLLSFGRVEATWKEYPRLWIAGERQQVRERADAVMRILAARALYVCMVVVLACGVFDKVDLADERCGRCGRRTRCRVYQRLCVGASCFLRSAASGSGSAVPRWPCLAARRDRCRHRLQRRRTHRRDSGSRCRRGS